MKKNKSSKMNGKITRRKKRNQSLRKIYKISHDKQYSQETQEH